MPASFTTTRSASASVVAVAAVSPSIMFSSVAVAVTPSRMFSSAEVDVIATPPIDRVEKLPVEAVVAPIVVLSIEPALMSAVSATRLSMFAVPSI